MWRQLFLSLWHCSNWRDEYWTVNSYGEWRIWRNSGAAGSKYDQSHVNVSLQLVEYSSSLQLYALNHVWMVLVLLMTLVIVLRVTLVVSVTYRVSVFSLINSFRVSLSASNAPSVVLNSYKFCSVLTMCWKPLWKWRNLQCVGTHLLLWLPLWIQWGLLWTNRYCFF